MANGLSVADLRDLEVGSQIVVFFCDIPDAAGLARRLGGDWPGIMSQYQDLVRGAVEGSGGFVEDGDATSFFATFVGEEAAQQAVDAASAVERNLRDLGTDLQAAIGVHAGRLGESIFRNEFGGPRFIGLDVHRCARVRMAARPGQVLVTGAVTNDNSKSVSGDGAFEDLGFYRLRDFPESVRLFNLVVFDDRRAEFFGPPDTLDYRPTNLTADDRPLLGRDELVARAKHAFLEGGHRLVTFTGPGGVGKTRVGIAVGSELLEEHRGGVWLVRAETLRRTQQLLPEIAATLNVRDVPGRDLLDALIDRMEGAPMLLVIDNLEQLTGVAEIISELIERTTSLRILATSQTPLRVGSETVLAVAALDIDDGVELFNLGARLAGTTLDLHNADVKAMVIQLIERLDRLPLAIELAAAQLRHLTLAQLSRGVESQLELRLAQPGKPERQQSLKAIIDWSVAALSSEAKQLFTRLGIFTGLTILELIEEVCGHDINVLEASATLVDFSLLRRVGIGFGMPPTIQKTALQLLTSSPQEAELRRLHATAMAKRAQLIGDINKLGPGSITEATVINGNFIPAVEWARNSDQEIYFNLVTNLSTWWGLTGQNRLALDQLSAALELNGISNLTRERLLRARGSAFTRVGVHDKATADLTEALALVDTADGIERGNLLTVLSLAQMWDDARQAATSAESAVKLFRKGGALDRMVTTLAYQAQALIKSGNVNAAGPVLDEATVLSRLPQNQNAVFAAGGLSNTKGDWALAKGQPLNALEFFATALSKDEWSRTLVFYDTAGVVVSLKQLAQFDTAIELLIALETSTRELGYDYDRLSPVVDWPHGILKAAREALSAYELSEAESRGRKISIGQLVTRALAIANEVLEANGIEPVRLTSPSAAA